MKLNAIWLLLAISVFISGCVTTSVVSSSKDSETAINACMKKCGISQFLGKDLSPGPCLSNNIYKDWVCDVVHSPRQAIDDLPENQCSEYGKTAHHFVEVDLNCNLVRAS